MAETAASDETVAAVAAIALFEAETAPGAVGEEDAIGPWQRTALREGVSAKGIVEDSKGGERWLS